MLPESADIPTPSPSRKAKISLILLGGFICCLLLAYNRNALGDLFKTNFDEISMNGGTFMEKGSDDVFSGTLQLRGDEILEVGQVLFAGSEAEPWIKSDTSGLLLELTIEEGVASGKAIAYANLRSDELADHLPPGASGLGFTLAKWFAPRRKVASANLADGKLHGQASVWSPSGDGLSLYKMLEVGFADNQLHGSAVRYYRNGNVRQDVSFERGTKSGSFQQYYPSGELEVSTEYDEGNRGEHVREHYLSGELRSESRSVGGVPTSRVDYYPTGQRQREVVFSEGALVSVHEWYSSGESTDTPPNGVLQEYHRNGKLHSQRSYVDGEQHGPFKVFYADNQLWEEGTYVRASLDGAHKKWWKNGERALEETWREGKLHGSYQRWYDNAVSWEKATYEAGKRVGRYEKRWMNGKLAHDYEYANGKIEGRFKLIHDNGKSWEEGVYSSGRRIGEFKKWYPDGTLRLQAFYTKGQLDGEFKNWLEDGSVYEFATYENGNKVRSTLVD